MLRIKELAKERNIRMQELAKMINTTPSTLSQIISGRVSLSRLQDIAKALDVPIVDLFESEPVELYEKRGDKVRKLTPGEWEKAK